MKSTFCSTEADSLQSLVYELNNSYCKKFRGVVSNTTRRLVGSYIIFHYFCKNKSFIKISCTEENTL